MINLDKNKIAAVVLAGGKSRRMEGSNKLSLPFGTGTLLSRAIERLRGQVSYVVLNCNELEASTSSQVKTLISDIPVIADRDEGYAGPLDGLISVMEWLQVHNPGYKWLLSAPVDCPFLPDDYLQKLQRGLDEPETEIALAVCGVDKHYTCALWSLELATAGRQFLNQGKRALRHFIAEQQHLEINFDPTDSDAFFNINTLEDYEYAISKLAKRND